MIQLTCLAPCAWCCSQNEDSGNGKLLVRFARSNVEHGQSPTDYAAPPRAPAPTLIQCRGLCAHKLLCQCRIYSIGSCPATAISNTS
jgi:hypothetical protein